MQFIPPYDQLGVTPPGPWTNAAPQAGVQGSIVNADVFPAVQNEILNVQDEAGLTRDGANLAQLLQALRSGKLTFFVDEGTADALAVTLRTPLASLAAGVELTILKGAAANATATPKLSVGTSALPLVKADGTALAIGDLPANTVFAVRSDGTNFRVLGLVPSQVLAIVLANITATQIFNITQQAAPGTGLTGHQEYTTFQPQGAATHTLSASFTAPARGNIQATSKLSTTSQPGLSNAIAIYVNGNAVAGSADSVAGTITDTSNCTVNKGDAVQIVSTVTATQALAYNSAQYLDYFFIPS